MSLPDAIGWAATAVFTASYFTAGQSRLRRVQMAGATLWLTYGLVTRAAPVIGANALVLSAAFWAEYREYRHRLSARAPQSSASTGVASIEAEAA